MPPKNMHTKPAPLSKKTTEHIPPYPLFGEYIPKGSEKGAIPHTLLNLKLVGILKANDKMRSQAIIQILGGEEAVYRLNSKLPGEAKIVRIFDDSVLLLRQGKLERLSIPRPKLSSSKPSKPLEFKP